MPTLLDDKIGSCEIGPPNERQGAYLRTNLEVWHCGDDVCDCAQVRVERVHEHRLCPGLQWRVLIWAGTYLTEAASAAVSEQINRELMQAWREMKVRYPGETWGYVTFPEHPERY